MIELFLQGPGRLLEMKVLEKKISSKLRLMFFNKKELAGFRKFRNESKCGNLEKQTV